MALTRTLVTATFILVCPLVLGCSPADPGNGNRVDEFACRASNALLEAVFYVRQSGGAAGSQEEFVVVRPVADQKGEVVALEMGHGYDVRLTWVSPTELTIGYPDDANTANWSKQFSRDVGGTHVGVRLQALAAKEGLFVDKGPQCYGGTFVDLHPPNTGGEIIRSTERTISVDGYGCAADHTSRATSPAAAAHVSVPYQCRPFW